LSKVWSIYEVIVAIGGLDTVFADFLTIPTFTSGIVLAGTGVGGTFHYITGDIFKVTLTASEPIAYNVAGGLPYITVTINGTARRAYLDMAETTSTNLDFDYILVAGDVATAGQVTVGTAITLNGAVVNDIAGNHVAGFTPGTFVAPVVTTVTAN
jgi:hypothetical protein